MANENTGWGAPRIHAELLKLGFEVGEATVSRYMPRRRKPPSQTWRTFLLNHTNNLASIDFFVVPTATFRVLYVFVVLEHARRRIVHFNVTDGPSARWAGQQIVNAFPWDSAPKYLMRDRDKVYGADFVRRVHAMGIEQVLTAPRSPWQNPYCERVIGTIRRECLDHVIVLGEQHLRRILREYVEYYHGSRTHLSLDKDAPDGRDREALDDGKVIAFPKVGGLHHRLHTPRGLRARRYASGTDASLATSVLRAANRPPAVTSASLFPPIPSEFGAPLVPSPPSWPGFRALRGFEEGQVSSQ
jgi:transposase InsO family protein